MKVKKDNHEKYHIISKYMINYRIIFRISKYNPLPR